jgi:hypothetical protein
MVMMSLPFWSTECRHVDERPAVAKGFSNKPAVPPIRSMFKAVLARADKDGFVSIYVNFLGVLSAADVAERRPSP